MKIKRLLVALMVSLSMTVGVIGIEQTINHNDAQVVNAAKRRHRRRTRKTHKKRTHHYVDRTKIYTSIRPVIIGNRKSHIYHVYRQHSYRMNRGNAVYFKSEAAARAAGYRKSLR
ncbi:hypothetical protein [Lactobacillus sp. LL6]|uniref:sunset domain-containing protein n=1 Tax=Lactobacillus sp. LL6 TaxID=2596827 RepID=UPI00118578EF|nr:hypothetical protein [Lactobacillus sp. LL6]TSO25705.1 hypothetical protein FOD82_01100 [Lactobacillus sp. LL6]